MGREQDIPPILDLQKDIEYFKDIVKGEIRYEQFWLNATKMGVDSFKIGLDNLRYTQRYVVWLQSIPRGVSRTLPMQLRGRVQEECIVNDCQDKDAGAKVEELRVQLSSLLTTVEGHQNSLYRCTPQEAGTRDIGFLPNIKV